MKRCDFPKPFSTCLVDTNSQGAYDDLGIYMRKYPRLLPVPYNTVSTDENRLLLEPWQKNVKLYPQLFFLVSKDVPVRDPASCKNAILGIGLGLGTRGDGIIQSSIDPHACDESDCRWYSLYTVGSQVLSQELVPGINARSLELTISSETLGTHVFRQSQLQFDPEELLTEMNVLLPYRKYDLFSLGAADAPLYVPIEKKFQPGEMITISCPELGKLEIVVDDQRDPDTFLPSWKPREFYLEPGYPR